MKSSPPIPLWKQFKDLVTTPDLPSLGPQPRAGRKPASSLKSAVDEFVRNHSLGDELTALLHCAALLWHDHLDQSHTISQSIDTADGSFLHGIMHRREPDYGNAKYWFRRVGTHSSFPGIAERASALLNERTQSELERQLCPGSHWDSFAFVDACEEAAGSGLSDELRALQEVEFDCLLADLFDRY